LIISSPEDFRAAAKRRLPPFLFDYIDGGAFSEDTLRRNTEDLRTVHLRQRVLKGAEHINLGCELFGEQVDLPLALSPVGLTGMYARRGEVQAAKAAQACGVAFTQSTVSVGSIEEVTTQLTRPIWFQLYVLRDRAFMKDVLERARASGGKTLVFTVDMPVPGARYRDAHSGMSGPNAGIRRIIQAARHPRWALNVGLRGRPHDLGNISAYRGKRTSLADYIGWLGDNFDPSISWSDLEWIREFWPGNLVIKGILDPADVEDALRLGADGIVVSNHGGRQLDGVPSTISVLPAISDIAAGRAKILIDGGIRNGLDVVRALCLGADMAMIGRSYIYALAAKGQVGVETLLGLYKHEMQVALTLVGASSVDQLGRHHLAAIPG